MPTATELTFKQVPPQGLTLGDWAISADPTTKQLVAKGQEQQVSLTWLSERAIDVRVGSTSHFVQALAYGQEYQIGGLTFRRDQNGWQVALFAQSRVVTATPTPSK